MPIAPPSKLLVAHCPLNLILKFVTDVPSFTTINTFFPAEVLNAALYKLPTILLAIRAEPGGTNLDACATI